MSDLTNHDFIDKHYADFYPDIFPDMDDLTAELQKLELNICDKCGTIKSTYALIWLEYLEDIENNKVAQKLLEKYTAVCKDCYK